jgi:hypothetical protein
MTCQKYKYTPSPTLNQAEEGLMRGKSLGIRLSRTNTSSISKQSSTLRRELYSEHIGMPVGL